MQRHDASKYRILVVDDDDVTRKLLREVLEKEGYQVQLSPSGEDAVARIRSERFHLVLSDIRMAELGGLAVLREAKSASSGTVVILMTGFGSMEGAIDAIQEGAFDYVSKPFRIDDLKKVVERAARHWESLHGARVTSPLPKFEVSYKGLIGKSPKIVEIYKTLARAALSDAHVLVTGERGTGKELVARAIHDNSQRRSQRFSAVNCESLAENVLEQELFGENGVFQRFPGGTIYIDEVADLTAGLQVRLLRALQDGQIRIAGSGMDLAVDARLIAGTHKDLESLVRAGRFREDLYFRLNVISIALPPLRERMEDLPDLVGSLLARYADKHGKVVSHLSEEAMALLMQYSWPGNVRELEHAIERAVAMAKTSVLFPEDFPAEVATGGSPAGAHPPATGSSLEDLEKAHIIRVLQEVGFNKSKASEILGIDRATLYRKAQRYGIELRGK